MRIDILTLFPDTVSAVLHESIIGRAAKKGIVDINCVQIRDFTENKQKQVDDYPYGGGFGCVMMAQPLKSCLDYVMESAEGLRSRVIYLSPQGQPYTQETAKRLNRDYDHLVLVCGHYEGVDERFIEQCVDEEISLGDFVLTGGEIAAMAVADSVCRLVPGVLALNSMNIAFNSITPVHAERIYHKSLEEYILAPIAPSAFVIGKIAAAVLRALISSTLIIVLALLFGAELSALMNVSTALLFLTVLILNSIIFAGVGFFAAMKIKTYEEMSQVNTYVLLPMSFLCGTFFSTATLPPMLRILIDRAKEEDAG